MRADLAVLLVIAEPANIAYVLESQDPGTDFGKAFKDIVTRYELR